MEAGTDAAHCMVGAHYWILQRLIDEDWNLPAILIKHTYLFVVTGSAFGEAPHTTGAQTSHTQTTLHTHTSSNLGRPHSSKRGTMQAVDTALFRKREIQVEYLIDMNAG